jgi:hypothetical protein
MFSALLHIDKAIIAATFDKQFAWSKIIGKTNCTLNTDIGFV